MLKFSIEMSGGESRPDPDTFKLEDECSQSFCSAERIEETFSILTALTGRPVEVVARQSRGGNHARRRTARAGTAQHVT